MVMVLSPTSRRGLPFSVDSGSCQPRWKLCELWSCMCFLDKAEKLLVAIVIVVHPTPLSSFS